MGLDTVELVMEFEDEFGLKIPDADAERMCTIGDTATYIVAALRARRPERCPEGVCPSSHAFFRLRRELLDAMVWTIPPGMVRPHARLMDLVPEHQRWLVWTRVRRAVGLETWPRFRVTAPRASRFPPPETTIREVVQRMLDREPRAYYANGEVDEDRVLRAVVRITSEQLGVRESDIGWDTHYVRDLHAD